MFESKEKERERGRKRDQPRFTPMCVRGHVRARAAPARCTASSWTRKNRVVFVFARADEREERGINAKRCRRRD